MKKSKLLLMLFCMLAIQLSAQQKNPEKEKESAQLASQLSSISLKNLITQKRDSYVITKEHVSSISGVRHVYLRQAINGLEVYGTESGVHIDKTGKVLMEHNKFLSDIGATLKNSSQGITARAAIASVANQMGYKISNLQEIKSIGGKNKAAVFNKAGISSEDIPTKLMYYYKVGAGTQLVWELSIAEKTSSDWWNFRVDAATGKIIDKDNWTVSCNILGDHESHVHAVEMATPFIGPMEKPAESISVSTSNMAASPAASYRVYARPIESPNYGTRTLVSNPENLTASPFGWHDTNGVDGAEFTNSRGNNTDAYDDDNANNNPDGKYATSPGGNLIFDFPLNTTYSAGDQSENAAVTNLFYWTNIIHDVTYQYGFDEASGNFQQNNYGKGGLGNDPVNAEAQDGSGTCNANFGTPGDGSRPRMQMYVCNSRDGDLDNMVIIHEYGHGISNRLSTLGGQEQMGEGWSDYYGLMLTMKSGDAGPNSRGVGTWLIGEGPGGPGIRTWPYSTNFGVNPHTYDDIKTEVAPHGVGSVWAEMLWEMTWELIADHGFDPDIYNGTGGNNISLALVTEGLKLQASQPGFVDGRDAILAADMAIYAGANQCAIWDAFARRGLGYSANQGSSGSKTDGTEAFDLPPTFSSFIVVDEVCLSDGIQTGLSGGNPAGGVYSGSGVTDDGNGNTFTFDPSVGGPGLVTITYVVNDLCTGAPTTLTDDINVTNDPPEIVCVGSGLIPMTGSQFSNPGTAIPDNNATGVTVNMNVAENVSITDLDVNLNISHTWVGDLIITIKSPLGTTATIINRVGVPASTFGCSGDNLLAILNDEAATPVENECAGSVPTINGSFTPNSPLSIFDGESTSGTWQLTVSDNAGGDIGTINSWGIDYDYEVTAPVFDVTLDGSGNATINAEDLLYSVTVECGGYTVLAGNPLAATVSFSCTDTGLNTVPVQVTNDGGAISTCSAIVNVIGGGGGGGPFLCPGDITNDNDLGICGAVVTYTVDSPSGCSGGSGIVTQTVGLPSGSTFPVGTTTNTFEFDDGINPVQTCSFDVTIEDTEFPIANCATSFTVQLDANGMASITAADVDNGSTDNCSVASTSIDITDFTCADIGDNNVILTVTDVNGNSSMCTTVVTVEDNVAPTAVCQNITVQLDASGNVSIAAGDIDGGSNDACGIDTVAIDITDLTCADIGPNNVTLTVTDVNGNISTCVAVVTVEDDFPPTITCPANITANTDAGMCSAAVSFPMAVASDNCSATVSQTGGLSSGSDFPVGVSTIEFTATDGGGNTTVCSFTITVTDNELPTMVCQNITIQLDDFGDASITAADIDGGSTDNCGISSVSVSPSNFDCSDVGENPVVLTVIDIHGNSNTCTAIVTVEDITPPVAVCQNIIVELDPVTGTVTISGADVDGGSTDACGIDTYSLDIDTFDCSNIGDNSVVLTVIDVNGNVSTCTAIVTVVDNAGPILVCQDFTLELGPDGTAMLDPNDVIASNSDNCGIGTVAVDINEFRCADIGTPVTVQVFASDVNGNLSTCTALVTVVDLLAPVITCPADQTIDPGPGNLFYIVPDYFATGEAAAIDNCTNPVTLTTQNPAAGTALSDGVYTITLTAEDEYGNTSTCIFQLTIESVLGVGNNYANIGSLQMYPNPAKNTVTIGNPQSLSVENLSIFDLRGRMVKSIDLRGMGTQKIIDVSEMAAATYLVIIQGEKGQITKRLIKE